MLNRAVLIARPAKPFLDWAAKPDDSGVVPDAEGEQTAYLIPEFDDEQEAALVLKAVYKEVFERELHAWHTDERDWPQQRTFEVFRQWFKVELHSVVEDLCADGLLDDDE